MVTVAEDVAHGRALAKDAQGPGFHFQHCQKKKILGMVFSREVGRGEWGIIV
jgi:hypothetical protein